MAFEAIVELAPDSGWEHLLFSPDVVRTMAWYEEKFGFRITRRPTAELQFGCMQGFGGVVCVQGVSTNDERTKEFLGDFLVSDAAAFQQQCRTKHLKLVNDVMIDGSRIGYVDLEDCDGRVVRFREMSVS